MCLTPVLIKERRENDRRETKEKEFKKYRKIIF
jgi:hypothetical protein